MGSVIHSSQITGRMEGLRIADCGLRIKPDSELLASSTSISRPVATFVAIMQKASCGVRTLTACQLRLSTSTIALFSMSFINLVVSGWWPVISKSSHYPLTTNH